MDKKLAAEKIRARLERRIAEILECPPTDLPRLKVGSLVHFLFLLGEGENIGGFSTTFRALIDILGRENVWDIEEKPESEPEPEKVLVN